MYSKYTIIILLILSTCCTDTNNPEVTKQPLQIDSIDYTELYSCIKPKCSLDTFILIINKCKRFPLGDTIIATIARESNFDRFAVGKNLDKGLGQFRPIAAKYHNLNYDSLFDIDYSINAINLRYLDLKSRNKIDKELINGYGTYSNAK